MAATVPCQYKTGRTLGQGTYAVVKEAVHIKTGRYYACKVINKRLMEGREHMIRNEISVLKQISQGHPNIVTLWDYFETQNNLYLVTDLCQGGELFDRICAKGSYYERDAARLIKTICSAVEYLHNLNVVHRDLKPENLLFRSKDENSDLLIADFGLSKVIDDTTFNTLTTTCGTPGYMAPEVFKKQGHGKPVDIWAIGVIAYFLLCGYTPFDRDNQVEEIQAICAGDYAFEPQEYWEGVTDTARDFVNKCLTVDQHKRLTASAALQHEWLTTYLDSPGAAAAAAAHQQQLRGSGRSPDLLPQLRRQFDAKKTFRKAILTVRAANKWKNTLMSEADRKLVETVEQGKKEAEKENVQEQPILHQA